jgi:tight adherence protein C
VTRALLGALVASGLAAWGLVDLLATWPRSARRGGTLARGTLALLARIGRRAGSPAAPADLTGRLAAAGVSPRVGVADLMAVKGGGALVAVVVAVPLAGALPGRLPLLAGVALPLAAFLAPDAWLVRRARARGRAMERELPDVLDLLRVAIDAGLPLGRALSECTRRDPGLLAGEIRAAAARLDLGLPSDDVFELVRQRCPAAGVHGLVGVLRRAVRYGSAPGEALAAQAQEARAAHARRVREEAARAAPKIQLVVALLLVPSVLLLVAAALVRTLL